MDSGLVQVTEISQWRTTRVVDQYVDRGNANQVLPDFRVGYVARNRGDLYLANLAKLISGLLQLGLIAAIDDQRTACCS